jgi:hypothetical protein
MGLQKRFRRIGFGMIRSTTIKRPILSAVRIARMFQEKKRIVRLIYFYRIHKKKIWIRTKHALSSNIDYTPRKRSALVDDPLPPFI